MCMCKEGWCVELGQEGGSLREGGGILWNTLKRSGTEKRGVEMRIFKRGSKTYYMSEWCCKPPSRSRAEPWWETKRMKPLEAQHIWAFRISYFSLKSVIFYKSLHKFLIFIINNSLSFCLRVLWLLFIFVYIFVSQMNCSNEKILTINWVFETQFKLSFLTPFTSSKKLLGKTPDIYIYISGKVICWKDASKEDKYQNVMQNMVCSFCPMIT